MKIRKDDTVLVIAGKDKGKKGKVRVAYPKDNRIIVEGINMIKKSTRARGENMPGGIIEREAPLSVASVMLICNKCNHPARIGYRVLDDGKKTRYCHACGEMVD